MTPILTDSYCKSITKSQAAIHHNAGMKYAEFSARLKQAFQEARLPDNQYEVARIFGVSAPMVSYYLGGHKLPSMETAILIAQKTGVCVEWLLTGRGPKNPQDVRSSDDWLDMRDLDHQVRRALRAAAQASKPPQSNNHH